jgi:hypothetical protein
LPDVLWISSLRVAGNVQVVDGHSIYPRMVSADGEMKLQLGDLILIRKTKYRLLAIVLDKRGVTKLLAVRDDHLEQKPQLLSAATCQLLPSDDANLDVLTSCLQTWINTKLKLTQKEGSCTKPIPKENPKQRARREHRRPQPYEEPVTTGSLKRKADASVKPAKKLRVGLNEIYPKTTNLPSSPLHDGAKTMTTPGTTESTALLPPLATHHLAVTPTLEFGSSPPTLSLQLSLHKRSLQDLQNDMIRNEIHAHEQLQQFQLNAHEERQRILHMVEEQRARALQDEQLLLQSILLHPTNEPHFI